jgi:hypothetical protein
MKSFGACEKEIQYLSLTPLMAKVNVVLTGPRQLCNELFPCMTT